MRPALVILDPLVALETAGIDVHRQSAQRAILAPLQALATEYQCSIVCVVHLRKGATDNVNHRVAGSIDLVAAARTVWMVGTDPRDPDQRAVAVSKSNLGPCPAAHRFTLDAGRFLWDPEAARDLTAEDLFGSRHSENDRERQLAVDKAKEWILDFLARGPRAALDCQSEAEKAGISRKTLQRAKRELGVRSQRLGKAEENKWAWYMPENHEPQKSVHDSFFQGCGHSA